MKASKKKVESIYVGKIHGDMQEVFINGNYHEYDIHMSPYTVLDELSKYYDFDSVSEEELEELW